MVLVDHLLARVAVDGKRAHLQPEHRRRAGRGCLDQRGGRFDAGPLQEFDVRCGRSAIDELAREIQ